MKDGLGNEKESKRVISEQGYGSYLILENISRLQLIERNKVEANGS